MFLRLSLRLSTTLAAATALAAPAGALQSLEQSEPLELEGFVVTVNRWAQPAWTVAANTTIIDGAELERRGVQFVGDALALLPGLAVSRTGSFGAITSLFMRGAEPDHVLVLVDGVQVNAPGGSVDFAGITTDNIERIEVVRGSGSALHGSDAVGGIVHIFTKRGYGPLRFRGSFEAGSFGTRKWMNTLSGGSEGASYSFSLGRSMTDGTLELNNQHRQHTFTSRVQLLLDEGTDATATVRYHDRTFHYPTDGSGAIVDANAFSFGDALTLGLDVGRDWSDRLETRLSIGLHESDYGIDDQPDDASDNIGFFGYASLDNSRRASADLRAILRLGGWSTGQDYGGSVAVGAELEHQSALGFNESLSEWGASGGRSDYDRGNRAAYAQFSHAFGNAAVNAGVRLDDNERYGTAVTQRGGATWRLPGTGTRLRLSAGTAIKEPTFFETYATGFTTGNPDLEPERSNSVEVGVEQRLGEGVQLGVTAYRQVYSNLIQYTFTPPTPGAPNFFNVAEARARGIEAEAGADFGGVRVWASGGWTATEAIDAGLDDGAGAPFVSGEPLLRRPSHTLALKAALPIRVRVRLDAVVRRIGERRDLDFSSFPSTSLTLDPYTTADLGVEFDLVRRAGGDTGALSFRVENLFDAQYEEVHGFPSPGRGVYFGGRLRLGG